MDPVEKIKSNTFRHPWEVVRAKSIISIIPQKITNPQFADIGSGDMYFAHILSTLTDKKVFVADIDYEQNIVQNKFIVLNSIYNISDNSVDILFLMDVLEHIKNEKKFFTTILNKIKKKGYLILTVPAFNFLFSEHDFFLKHYRRYNLVNLEKFLSNYNLEIIKSFYFFTSLYLLRLIQVILVKFKLFNIKKTGIGNWRLSRKHVITKLIVSILIIDFRINYFLRKFFIKLPGLSICIICQKKSA